MKDQFAQDLDQSKEERKIPQEYRLISKILKKPGLTLFSYNLKTNEVEEVQLTKKHHVNLDDPKKLSTVNRVEHQKDHLYIQALNKKNATRKFKKILNGTSIHN